MTSVVFFLFSVLLDHIKYLLTCMLTNGRLYCEWYGMNSVVCVI